MDYNLSFNRAGDFTVSAGAGTKVATDVLDLGFVSKLGDGRPVIAKTQLTGVNTLAAGTSYQALIETSPDNSTWTEIARGPVVPLASLIKGAVLLDQALPRESCSRYFRSSVVVVGAMTGTATATSYLFVH